MSDRKWNCKRCGHQSTTKCNLIKHLSRINHCTVTNIDISVEDHIAELKHRKYNERTYDCNYCNRKFNSSKNRSRHHKVCKHKPTTNDLVNNTHVFTHVFNGFVAMTMIASGRFKFVPNIPQNIPPTDIYQKGPMEGFVYCLANTCMPGIVKIGLSMNVKRRMLDLSGATSAPFHCCYAKKVANMRQSEKWLHNELERFRVPSKNEFFQIDSFYVKTLMDKLDGEYYDVDNAYIIKSQKNNETLENETTDGNVSCIEAQPCN